MVVAHLHQDVIECLLLVSNTHPLKRALVFLEIAKDVNELVAQVVDKIRYDLAREGEVVA